MLQHSNSPQSPMVHRTPAVAFCLQQWGLKSSQPYLKPTSESRLGRASFALIEQECGWNTTVGERWQTSLTCCQVFHQIWNCHQKSKYDTVTNARRLGYTMLTSYHIQGSAHVSCLGLCLKMQMSQERWSPLDYPVLLAMCSTSWLTWSPMLWRNPKNFHPWCLVSWVAGIVKAAGSHKQENALLVFFISLHCPQQNAARSGERNKGSSYAQLPPGGSGDPPQTDT